MAQRMEDKLSMAIQDTQRLDTAVALAHGEEERQLQEEQHLMVPHLTDEVEATGSLSDRRRSLVS